MWPWQRIKSEKSAACAVIVSLLFTIDLQIDVAGRDDRTTTVDALVRRRPLIVENWLRIDDFAISHPQIVNNQLMISHQAAIDKLN